VTTNETMIYRYVSGLIANQGIAKQFWLDPTKISNAVARGMVSELRAMYDSDTPMTPELIADRLMKNRAVSSAMTLDQVMQFVSESAVAEIPRTEIHSLYEAIMRDYVFSNATKATEAMLPKLDNPEAIAELQALLRSLTASLPGRGVSLKQQMNEAKDEACNGAKGLIKTGINLLDRKLGGFSRGEVSIIAGRPGHGKTSLALQFAINMLDQGYRVLIISKEMKSFRLLHKLIANKTSLTSKQLHRGELDESEQEILANASTELTMKYDDKLFIYDDVYSTHEIEMLVAKHKPDVVIDDFIQLTAADDLNMRLEILRIMKAYKSVAKEYNCAVITLSQLNRSIENRDDPYPRLSDLAESGAIEQLAADVWFVYYGHKVDVDSPEDQVMLIASKTRYGTTGRFVLGFDGSHMRYRQIPVQVAG
jgi:replicative DNA helicase